MKTQHQLFIDELHRQLTPDIAKQSNDFKTQNEDHDVNIRREDTMDEIERKFDELFGGVDDND